MLSLFLSLSLPLSLSLSHAHSLKFSLISFSIISSASFTSKILKERKVAYHGWYTDDGRISYSDSTALGFSVGGGVIVWLGSMAILYLRLSGGAYLTYYSSIRSIFVGLHYFTLLFAYTSAIACSSISADLVADDWFDEDDDYDDDISKKTAKQERQLEDDLKAFNEKIRAGCCFAWFATITMLVASIIVARASACTCDENRAVDILKGTDMPFSSSGIVVGWNRHVNTRGGGFGDPNAPLPNAPLPPPQQAEAPSSAIL